MLPGVALRRTKSAYARTKSAYAATNESAYPLMRMRKALMRMRKGLLVGTPLLAVVTVLAGCGGGTKTVTISSAPQPHVKPSARTSSSPSSSSTSSSMTTQTTQTTQTTTRTSTAPRFVTEEAVEADATAAVDTVGKAGYTPLKPSEYHPHQTLQVLVATKTSSAHANQQHAFFFIDGRYLGTDASQPSGSIKVVSQKDTEVTLAYGLYRPKDSLCCPSGGEADVTFQLDNGKLVPLQQIPPASSSTGLSRM